MAVTLKRQISDDEKAIILKQHGRCCFANGHLIPEGETVQFDHIRAFAQGGASQLDNIAPMCGMHNKEKGVLSLFDFRTKLKLQEFFATGDKLTLKQLLSYLLKNGDIEGYGEPVAIRQEQDNVTVQSAHFEQMARRYKCPTTGWEYFYATLPISVLDSDDDDDDGAVGLQPRYLIFEKVFDLFRHFQSHPVLQPSIGRVVGNRIRLFDGQHKAAALLWNGRRDLEVKVYLQADLRLLNQTNIAAHDKYAQTRFFSSIMVLKLGSQFGSDFNDYKNVENEEIKSEAGFIKWLKGRDSTQTNAQINERFRSFLYNAVLQDQTNRLARLVSAGNRGSDDQPITIDMLSKSLFTSFLLREPTNDNLAGEGYKREVEVNNAISILNMLDEVAFHAWNPKATSTNEHQRGLSRMLRSKSMMAWAELLRDAVCAKLDIHDSDEKARCLYRELSEIQMAQVKHVVNRLVSWKRWYSPENDEVDRVLADNRSEVKLWFKSHGLTTGYLLGAAE
jgi:hypothetical protein